MILNSGLDAACTTTAAPGTGTAPNQTYPDFCEFIRYAGFGTGSTAPTATDTSLDSQVGSRSDDRGGFSNSVSVGLDAGDNTIWAESTFTRVFAISSNVNATEWGLAPANTGNLSVRELFRADPNDDQSSPITLTLEDGDQLQLVVTLRVQAVWEYQTKSFVITGTAGNDTNGTHTGEATVSSGAGTTQANIVYALASAWPGGAGNLPGSTAEDYIVSVQADPSGTAKNQNLPTTGTWAQGTYEAYTPGDYYRDFTAQFATSAANGDHYGWVATYTSSTAGMNRGYRFLLTDPPYLTKTSTHRLTLTVRKHISRL